MSVIEHLQPWATDGDRRFTSALRRLVARSSLGLDAVDVEGIEPDPALFGYFAADPASRSATLEQLVVGALPPDARPSCVPAVVDSAGVAHLPQVGYARTPPPNGDQPRVAAVSTGDVEAERRIPGGPQCIVHAVPTVAGSLESATGHADNRVDESCVRHVDELQAAWRVIGDLQPDLQALLRTSVRHVVLFHDEQCNSFADAAYYGGVFCNMHLGRGRAFLAEDLAHQGGHNVLMAGASRPHTWFEVDAASTPVDGAGEHGRNLYVLWHGTVTEALMSELLGRWLRSDAVEPELEHELRGRYAFVYKRFESDLATLVQHRGAMTPTGRELLRELRQAQAQQVDENASWVADVDVANQGYNFSYERFCERHPGERLALSRAAG